MITVPAVSAQVPGELSFYNLVVFLHVAAALVGFGALFAYPIFFRIGMGREPRGLPLFHRVQQFLSSRVITGGLAVLLLTGIYQAATGPFDFGEPWVGWGILVVIGLGALGGLYFTGKERRLQALAERDIAAAREGEVSLSREYVELARRVELMTYVASGLVLVTLLLMVLKPGS